MMFPFEEASTWKHSVIFSCLYLTLCLITMVSFSDRTGVSDMAAVDQLQEGLIRALRALVMRRHPDDSTLFPKLLLRLPDLRTLSNLHSDKLLAFRIDP